MFGLRQASHKSALRLLLAQFEQTSSGDWETITADFVNKPTNSFIVAVFPEPLPHLEFPCTQHHHIPIRRVDADLGLDTSSLIRCHIIVPVDIMPAQQTRASQTRFHAHARTTPRGTRLLMPPQLKVLIGETFLDTKTKIARLAPKAGRQRWNARWVRPQPRAAQTMKPLRRIDGFVLMRSPKQRLGNHMCHSYIISAVRAPKADM
jgi:hypothetical protein